MRWPERIPYREILVVDEGTRSSCEMSARVPF